MTEKRINKHYGIGQTHISLKEDNCFLNFGYKAHAVLLQERNAQANENSPISIIPANESVKALSCRCSIILILLHCRAARIVFNLPKDMASHDVLEHAEWFTIRFYYKLAVFKCMHKAYNGRLPSTLNNCIAKKRDLSYSIEHAIHYWCHVLTHVL